MPREILAYHRQKATISNGFIISASVCLFSMIAGHDELTTANKHLRFMTASRRIKDSGAGARNIVISNLIGRASPVSDMTSWRVIITPFRAHHIRNLSYAAVSIRRRGHFTS